jgi:hypothetical protein
MSPHERALNPLTAFTLHRIPILMKSPVACRCEKHKENIKHKANIVGFRV